MTIRDVAIREVGGSNKRLIGDGDPMVLLVAVAQTLQDFDGVRNRGLLDLDRLEPTLECGVLLEVLAVLVERGGADGLEFATGQHGLQDAGSVDGAFGGTGTDEGMDLVDEQDDVATGLDLLEDLLEPLLEIAAIARTGNKCTEIKCVELLVVKRLGNVVRRDGLGESFDNGGLANTGFADEHRVVLGATTEHLHDALGLAGTTDDRIELLLTRQLSEVATELIEHSRT